ncbi:hypothetical protein EH203_08120 [Pectobacterium carotovorum subsp. carotovorum]|uniref:hypothetical protein n=1 Tax=Pectobacterium carotovorum TaxID=554 RepID=UPI0013739FB4|nr:hypothetical protein [Pectobacterium carotovorum]QHP53791.1 hypothetical protein EH203_08120 [Pectobacterium carotovorum subsp. carotovorum]
MNALKTHDDYKFHKKEKKANTIKKKNQYTVEIIEIIEISEIKKEIENNFKKIKMQEDEINNNNEKLKEAALQLSMMISEAMNKKNLENELKPIQPLSEEIYKKRILDLQNQFMKHRLTSSRNTITNTPESFSKKLSGHKITVKLVINNPHNNKIMPKTLLNKMENQSIGMVIYKKNTQEYIDKLLELQRLFSSD